MTTSALISTLAVLTWTFGIGSSPNLAVAIEPQASPSRQRGTVIVLRPSEVDEVTRTALARVTGELTAAQFRVTILSLADGQDPTRQVESAVSESQAVAAFAIAHVNDNGRDTIAIWVSDLLGKRTTIQRMDLHGDSVSQDAAVLAVESIELIRASIAGLWPTPRPPAPEPPPSSPPAALPPPAAESGRVPSVAIGLGIAALQDASISGREWLGSVSAILAWTNGFAGGVRFSGLGPALSVSPTEDTRGSATLHRQLASASAGWRFWRNARVQGQVDLSLGLVHLSAEGTSADSRLAAHAADAWSMLGMAGVGASTHLSARISLTADVAAVLTARALKLQIADTTTGNLARPGLLAHVGLQTHF